MPVTHRGLVGLGGDPLLSDWPSGSRTMTACSIETTECGAALRNDSGTRGWADELRFELDQTCARRAVSEPEDEPSVPEPNAAAVGFATSWIRSISPGLHDKRAVVLGRPGEDAVLVHRDAQWRGRNRARVAAGERSHPDRTDAPAAKERKRDPYEEHADRRDRDECDASDGDPRSHFALRLARARVTREAHLFLPSAPAGFSPAGLAARFSWPRALSAIGLRIG